MGVKRAHTFLVDHFGIGLPVGRAGVHRPPGSRPRMPTPAFTPGMVFRLEAYAAAAAAGDPSTNAKTLVSDPTRVFTITGIDNSNPVKVTANNNLAANTKVVIECVAFVGLSAASQ